MGDADAATSTQVADATTTTQVVDVTTTTQVADANTTAHPAHDADETTTAHDADATIEKAIPNLPEICNKYVLGDGCLTKRGDTGGTLCVDCLKSAIKVCGTHENMIKRDIDKGCENCRGPKKLCEEHVQMYQNFIAGRSL